MSLKQNDIYNEYMYENNICTICQNEIYLSEENREDQMGQGHEYDMEDGHSENCPLFRVEANEEAKTRRIAYGKKKFTMPKITEETRLANLKWNKEHTEPTYRY